MSAIDYAPVMLAAFLALGFLLAGILVFLMYSALNRGYVQASARLGGSPSVSFLSFPSIRFADPSRPWVLSGRHGGSYSPGATFLSAKMPDSKARMQISQRTRIACLPEFFGKRLIRTRDPAFDSSFAASGSPPEICLRLLDADARKSIADIASHASGNARIVLSPGHLTASVAAVLDDGAELAEFGEKALALAARFASMLENAGGIEFAPDGSPGFDARRCLLCGDGFDGMTVFCRKCGAPHHRECWRFEGRCSAYGCGSKRFRRGR